jgi:hypothetical protein
MVLANRLADGRVVFLAVAGWAESIADGAVATDPDAAEALLARARADEARNLVVEPALVEVRDTPGGRLPVAFRERIRSAGPTVRTDAPR